MNPTIDKLLRDYPQYADIVTAYESQDLNAIAVALDWATGTRTMDQRFTDLWLGNAKAEMGRAYHGCFFNGEGERTWKAILLVPEDPWMGTTARCREVECFGETEALAVAAAYHAFKAYPQRKSSGPGKPPAPKPAPANVLIREGSQTQVLPTDA